jgi:hypothetical protein
MAVALSASFFAIAAPARATWTESGWVTIRTGNGGLLEFVEADAIEPDDIVAFVTIGSNFTPPEEGAVTFVGDGGTERQAIGAWSVRFGTGDVQSAYAEGSFDVGGGSDASSTTGDLEILNSDIVGGISVSKGALRVRAASKVGSIRVLPLGNAYIAEGSRTQVIETSEDSYLSVEASTVEQLALQRCDLRGTALIVDSSFNCGSLDMSSGADTTMYPFLSSLSEFRIENALRIADASFDVSGSVASTGSIELGDDAPNATSLEIAATNWTNAGGLTFTRFDGPVELVISGGSQFLQGGTMRIRNQASDGLVVTGAGTELEVDDDVFVGQWVLATQQPYPGTLTVADGAVVIVHGTLVIGEGAFLNLEPGGTIYAAAAELNGTINENGGTLVVPEPASAVAGAGVLSALTALVRRSRVRR